MTSFEFKKRSAFATIVHLGLLLIIADPTLTLSPPVKVCADNENDVHETSLKISAQLSSNDQPFELKLSYLKKPLKCRNTGGYRGIVNVPFYLPVQTTFFQGPDKGFKNNMNKLVVNFPKAQSNDEPIKFFASGLLNHTANLWSTFYDPEDYCLHRINQTHMEAQICMSSCDPGSPAYQNDDTRPRVPGDFMCIPKCCPPHSVLDLRNRSEQCKESGPVEWRPVFYDSNSLDDMCIARYEKPEVPLFHIQNRGCRGKHIFPALTLTIDDDEFSRAHFRLLDDGRLVRRNVERSPIQVYPRWLEVTHYCIDGLQNFKVDSDQHEPYTGHILHSAVFTCQDDNEEEEYNGDEGLVIEVPDDEAGLNSTNSLYPGEAQLEHLWKITGINFTNYTWDEIQTFFYGQHNSWREVHVKSYVYMASMYFSLIPLFLTIVAYWITWNISMGSLHGWTMFSHICSLFLMNLFVGTAHLFSQAQLANESPITCRVIGILAHFFFLSTFFWLSMVNFDVWLTFRSFKSSLHRTRGYKRFTCYALFSWGGPSLVIAVGWILNSHYGIHGIDSDCDITLPNYGLDRCYIHKQAEAVYLYYIILVLIVCNSFFFVLTIYVFHNYRKSTQQALSGKSKPEASQGELFLKLFIVMGVSFSFEYISWRFETDYESTESIHWAWIVIDCVNWTVRSVLIFIIFACKRKTLTELQRRVSNSPCLTNLLNKISRTTTTVVDSDPESSQGIKLTQCNSARMSGYDKENENHTHRA